MCYMLNYYNDNDNDNTNDNNNNNDNNSNDNDDDNTPIIIIIPIIVPIIINTLPTLPIAHTLWSFMCICNLICIASGSYVQVVHIRADLTPRSLLCWSVALLNFT